MSAALSGQHMAPHDRALLDRTMDAYRGKKAVYLQDASVAVASDRFQASGQFCITEPCYIDDTGHFNAVESIICYNQLMYFALAVAVRDDLLDVFSNWTLEDYWQRQLPDVLIRRQSIAYSRGIDAKNFSAHFEVTDITEQPSRNMLRLGTTIAFSDSSGGQAQGAVDLVLVNTPEMPQR